MGNKSCGIKHEMRSECTFRSQQQEPAECDLLWLGELDTDLAFEVLTHLDAVTLARTECSCRQFNLPRRDGDEQISLPQAAARLLVRCNAPREFVPSASMGWVAALHMKEAGFLTPDGPLHDFPALQIERHW